jgi:hypothetical protein
MLSPRAVCTDKTATALEIRHDKKYVGSTCGLGEEIEIERDKGKDLSYGTTLPVQLLFFGKMMWEHESW